MSCPAILGAVICGMLSGEPPQLTTMPVMARGEYRRRYRHRYHHRRRPARPVEVAGPCEVVDVELLPRKVRTEVVKLAPVDLLPSCAMSNCTLRVRAVFDDLAADFLMKLGTEVQRW